LLCTCRVGRPVLEPAFQVILVPMILRPHFEIHYSRG
jgi:hypothetical protein